MTMLFISHKTEDKAIAIETLQRAINRGYSERQIFLDSDRGSRQERHGSVSQIVDMDLNQSPLNGLCKQAPV